MQSGSVNRDFPLPKVQPRECSAFRVLRLDSWSRGTDPVREDDWQNFGPEMEKEDK